MQVGAWNAQVCSAGTRTDLLVFESLDADRLTRRLHPVVITGADDEAARGFSHHNNLNRCALRGGAKKLAGWG